MQWAPYYTVCKCACHVGGIGDRSKTVAPDDVVEAAVSCDVCRFVHCPALRHVQLPNDVPPPVTLVPPTPAPFCWEDNGEGAES